MPTEVQVYEGDGVPLVAETVEQAVENFIKFLSAEDRTYVRLSEPIDLHSTVGRVIRNRFNLWEPEGVALRKDCQRFFGIGESPSCLDDGILHPDSASQVIIKEIQKRL